VNKNQSKAVRALAVASALALIASATVTTSANAADTTTIGFSPMSLDVPALAGMAEGIKGYGGGKYGFNVVTSNPKFDPATQASDLRTWINGGTVKGFWSLAASSAALGPVLKEAQAKGVVAVVNGVPADYGFSGLQKGITFSRINYEKLGTGIGTQLAKCANFRLKGAAKVIYVHSQAGQVGSPEQEKAFKAALKKISPKSKIVATVLNKDGAQATAQTVVRAALQAHKDANAVIALSDEGTLGAITAFTAAGKKVTSMCMVGAGGSDGSKAMIKHGKLYALGELLFVNDLMQTVDELARLIKDPTATGKQLETPVKITTKNNLK
jgi:ABC-type sugar transport system substrate-binding protein